MADYVLIRQISAGYSADRICVLSPGGLGLKPDIHQPQEFFFTLHICYYKAKSLLELGLSTRLCGNKKKALLANTMYTVYI